MIAKWSPDFRWWLFMWAMVLLQEAFILAEGLARDTNAIMVLGTLFCLIVAWIEGARSESRFGVVWYLDDTQCLKTNLQGGSGGLAKAEGGRLKAECPTCGQSMILVEQGVIGFPDHHIQGTRRVYCPNCDPVQEAELNSVGPVTLVPNKGREQ